MTPLALALASGICWGTSDYLGGVESRRLGALTITLWSQLFSGVLLVLLLLAIIDQGPTAAALQWGAVAGLCSGSALLLFYRALAVGAMSIVAPVSACGIVLPVGFALATGRSPGHVAGVGILLAFLGILLVSRSPGTGVGHAQPSAESLALALGAAAGFGLFFVAIDHGTTVAGTSPLWVVAGARVGSIGALSVVIGAAFARTRSMPVSGPGRRIGAVGGIGVLDVTANSSIALATAVGNVAIVSVLGSLYPAVTVLLARTFLHERLNRMQAAGVGCALAGVVLMAAG